VNHVKKQMEGEGEGGRGWSGKYVEERLTEGERDREDGPSEANRITSESQWPHPAIV